MKVAVVSLALAGLAWFGSTVSYAEYITVNPTSDGSLYTCDGCNVVSDGAYVLAAGYIQGAVKFSSAAIVGTITQAFLTLNPYGLPLFGPDVDVYGYGTNIGSLDVADANAGTFLGTLVLPVNLGFGQDVYFGVTAFVATTDTPFLAFNLRSVGVDVFSSLEYNYGHPSQLLITTAVPEPTSTALLVVGLLVLGRIVRGRSNSPVGFALLSSNSNARPNPAVNKDAHRWRFMPRWSPVTLVR